MRFFKDADDIEDLVDSGHSCDERCYTRHHIDQLEHNDDNTTTALALEGAGSRGSNVSGERVSRELWNRADKQAGGNLDETARIYRELFAEWEDEQHGRVVLWEAQQAAERAARRSEHRRAAAARRSRPRVDRRSPNRPTRVEVHPEAWDVLKRQAIKKQTPLAATVGTLLVFAPLPNSAASESSDGIVKRFARLFIEDDDWLDVRERAVRLDVSTARLVGLIVEAEARRVGWKPEVER